jgi:hypothetical protein
VFSFLRLPPPLRASFVLSAFSPFISVFLLTRRMRLRLAARTLFCSIRCVSLLAVMAEEVAASRFSLHAH